MLSLKRTYPSQDQAVAVVRIVWVYSVLPKSVTELMLNLLLFAIIPLGTWCPELGLNLSFSRFTKEVI